jgi:hypothetical protein
VEVKRVYWIGYQGGSMVTQLWWNSQLSHNGFPMDGALVGAGSHKPNWWIYGVIFLSLNGQQPQVVDECRTLWCCSDCPSQLNSWGWTPTQLTSGCPLVTYSVKDR